MKGNFKNYMLVKIKQWVETEWHKYNFKILILIKILSKIQIWTFTKILKEKQQWDQVKHQN
jgi:hypothetical protein